MTPNFGSSIVPDSSTFRNHLVDNFGSTRTEGKISTGRQMTGRSDETIDAPIVENLNSLSEKDHSFSISAYLERKPENRINDAFLSLGYNSRPQDSYFEDVSSFLSLESDGSNILKSGSLSTDLSLTSIEEFQQLSTGITSTDGFMLAMMTRISPTVSGNFQFKSSAGKSDKFAMWLDTNGNGEFENIERILYSQSPVSANIQLESGKNYNLLSVYGSPSLSQINDFSPNQVPDLKLWLDAEDTTTITTVSDSVEVENWSNKVDSSVKMVSQTYKPDTGSSINGLNAIDFDKINTNQIEHMVAQKGSINWTPATEDGTISGEEAEKVQNLALFMVARVDIVRRSHFPFGFGWYDHFPWENGVVYWKHESKRPTFPLVEVAPLSCSLCFIRVSLADSWHT